MSTSFRRRDEDWRMGAVVYQVMPDRFAARDLEAKREVYAAPKRLVSSSESPGVGTYLPEQGVWSHELAFYGGDLPGLLDHLQYIRDLGADVLLMTPVFDARTNHGYDTLDYHRIAPHLGTREDLRAMVRAAHEIGLRVILDGVFNHVSQHCPWLEEAMTNEASEKRGWFDIDHERYEHGFRSWAGVKNLPELQVESETLRDALFRSPDSVVRSYLRDDDIDGWRLDVAWELGSGVLEELVEHAHTEKPGSVVLGEIWSPVAAPTGRWVPPLDGLLNMTLRELLLHWVRGRIRGGRAVRIVQSMVNDAGIEPMLRSHIVIENHDTPRIHSLLPDESMRRLLQQVCFALPGCVSFLYGMEVGLEGHDDPQMRAPMPWDRAQRGDACFDWTQRLLALRKRRALRVGDYVALETDDLFAFMRATDRYAETVWTFANATDDAVTETVYLRDAKLMNGDLIDEATGERFVTHCGFCEVTVPARSARILVHPSHEGWTYDPYKRID